MICILDKKNDLSKIIVFFRIIALLEGLSYILLLFIAVPIKYFANNADYVKLLGMPHGLLFMAYVLLAIIIAGELKWNTKTLTHVLLAGIIPFGTFILIPNTLKEYR